MLWQRHYTQEHLRGSLITLINVQIQVRLFIDYHIIVQIRNAIRQFIIIKDKNVILVKLFVNKKDAVVIENQVNGNQLAIRCINICFNFLRRQKSKMKKLFMFIMAAKAKTNDNEKEQHIIYNRNLKNRVVILTLPFYIRIKLNAGF